MNQTDVSDFLDSLDASPHTKVSYSLALRMYLGWAGEGEVTLEKAQGWIDSLRARGRSPNTLQVRLAALRRFCKWKGYSLGAVKAPGRQMKAPEYVSEDDLRRLLIGIRDVKLQAITALMYDTGARVGEILSLTVDNFDTEGFITVTRKGGRVDRVPVSEWGLRYLQGWLKERKGAHPLMFGHVPYSKVYYELKRVASNLGIVGFHPHQLRHARAVHLIRSGVSWNAVRDLLGHTRVSMTMDVYGRYRPADLREEIPAPTI